MGSEVSLRRLTCTRSAFYHAGMPQGSSSARGAGAGRGPRRRVLFVLPNLEPGGAERLVTRMLRHLPRDRIELHLALVARYGLLLDDVPDEVQVHHLRAGRVRRAARPLISLVWRIRPDVVLSTLGYMNLALIPLWPFLPRGTQLFVREANTLSAELPSHPRNRVLALAYRLLYPRADGIICPARAMADDLVRHFGIPASSIRYIPNPVDLESLGQQTAGPSPFRGRGPHLLGVGRLAPQKGFDLMVSAFAELSSALPEAQLWVLGEGEERPALEAQAEAAGVGARVHLVGHVPNPYRWMRHADVFVLSSRYEGLPNVVLEAIASGAPVAAFDCPGGTREILERVPGQSLVPFADVGALAEAILQRVRGGRETVSPTLPEEYRLPNVVRAYADLFCGLEDGSGAASGPSGC